MRCGDQAGSIESFVKAPAAVVDCRTNYKVAVKKGHKNLQGETVCVPFATETGGVRFYLEDDTGKVLVDAQGAEIDVPEAGREYLGHGTRHFQDEHGKEIEVTASGEMVTKAGLGARLGKLFGNKNAPPPAPFDPWIQKMCETMRAKDERLFDCVARAASRGHSEKSVAPGKTDKYLLHEYCLLPEYEYELTGTCTENPQPQSEHDLKMIVKGTNDPTFLISYGNEEVVEGDLLHQAKLYVFGGDTLSVASLGTLLWIFS